jgi:two-component system response regulator PilR (NtrC family)
LFYRLNVIQLSVPSLRERKSDIPLLSQHLLNKIAQPDQSIQLSKCAMDRLLQYDFPGNVRELENILERAYTLAENEEITANDLHISINQPSNTPAKSAAINHHESSSSDGINYAKICSDYPSIDDYLSEVEKNIILKAMESTRWNRTLAAKQLGISFRSLRYRLQKLGFDEESE